MAIYFGQDATTKLAQANAYYAVTNHLKAYDWDGHTDNERKAALLHAERDIDARMGLQLELSYKTTSFPIVENSSFRPDYAVFEHALFLLENLARTKAQTGGVEHIESEQYQQQEKTTGVTIAPEALCFLRANTLQIERG